MNPIVKFDLKNFINESSCAYSFIFSSNEMQLNISMKQPKTFINSLWMNIKILMNSMLWTSGSKTDKKLFVQPEMVWKQSNVNGDEEIYNWLKPTSFW